MPTPGRVVGGTEVDEEVPGPAGHLQQVPHAPQVHPQQAGSAPDGDHAPGCHPHVVILPGQLHDLTVQVVGALRWTRGYSAATAGGAALQPPAPPWTSDTEWRDHRAELQLPTGRAPRSRPAPWSGGHSDRPASLATGDLLGLGATRSGPCAVPPTVPCLRGYRRSAARGRQP